MNINGALATANSLAGAFSGAGNSGSGGSSLSSTSGSTPNYQQVASTLSTAVNSAGPSKLGSAFSGAASGASLGSAAGPWGMAAGAVIGGIVGAFSGGGGAPDHERPDLNKIAANNDITAQQASDVCGYEESHSPRNYDDICSQAANDNSYFLGLLNSYNTAHPTTQIKTATAVATEQAAPQYLQLQQNTANMLAGTNVPSPFANMSFTSAVANAKQQNMSIGDYLTALLNGAIAGAQQGASTAAAGTPLGQQVKSNAIKDWVKENQLPVAGGVVLLGWLVLQAVQNIKRK